VRSNGELSGSISLHAALKQISWMIEVLSPSVGQHRNT
jgi:hypothetical protein